MKERRKSYRERYFEDYEAIKIAANNRKGYRIEYRYIGDWMQWHSDRWSMGRVKLTLAILEMVSIAVYVAASLSGTPLTISRFANGFGALSLIPWLLELSGIVRFAAAKEFVKELSQKEIDQSIRAGCVLRAGLLFFSALAGLVDAGVQKVLTLAYLPVTLALLASALLSLMVWRLYNGLLICTYSNQNGQPSKPV